MYKIISPPPSAHAPVSNVGDSLGITYTRSSPKDSRVRRAKSNGSTEIAVYGETNPIATIHLTDDGNNIKEFKIEFITEPEAPHFVTVSKQEGGWILGVSVRDQDLNTNNASYTIYRNTPHRLPIHHVITSRNSSEIASAKGPSGSSTYTLTVTDSHTDPRLMKCLVALADHIE